MISLRAFLRSGWKASLRGLFLSGAALRLLNLHAVATGTDSVSTNEYTRVNAIFREHCLDCHGSQDPEGHFVLEDFDSLMKGGEIGTALIPLTPAPKGEVTLEVDVEPVPGETITTNNEASYTVTIE